MAGDNTRMCASGTRRRAALLMLKSCVECNSNEIVMLIKSNELHMEIIAKIQPIMKVLISYSYQSQRT
jgi:hypothetical protein